MSSVSWFCSADSAKEEKRSAQPKPLFHLIPQLIYVLYVPWPVEVILMFMLPIFEPIIEGATTLLPLCAVKLA